MNKRDMTLLAVGFGVGMVVQFKYDNSRIKKWRPLMVNAFQNCLLKARDPMVSDEEFKQTMDEELEFMRIALR